MTPSQQQAKDMQDEARRDQQADEKVRELEEEVQQLRGLLQKVVFQLNHSGKVRRGTFKKIKSALDGGGGDHASS